MTNAKVAYRIVSIEATDRGTFNLQIEEVASGHIMFCDDVKIWDEDSDSLEDMYHNEEWKDSHKHHFVRS